MDDSSAVEALGALAQESRLKTFRLLLRAGRDGMPAGEIARTLGVPHNTLSAHLTVLTRANLVHARREGRSIIYAANLEGTRALLIYLIEDCCRGKPDTCAPLIEATLAGCCAK